MHRLTTIHNTTYRPTDIAIALTLFFYYSVVKHKGKLDGFLYHLSAAAVSFKCLLATLIVAGSVDSQNLPNAIALFPGQHDLCKWQRP